MSRLNLVASIGVALVTSCRPMLVALISKWYKLFIFCITSLLTPRLRFKTPQMAGAFDPNFNYLEIQVLLPKVGGSLRRLSWISPP